MGVVFFILVQILLLQVFIAVRSHDSPGPRAGFVNVHLLPHSHDDVGWLKTAEQYYAGLDDWGLLPSAYWATGGVAFILDSVVSALSVNYERKFVVVEQYYFRRWYLSRSKDRQAQVKALVASGQLQFVNGGLVQHDEACPTYLDMVDQTTAGARWLTETFGEIAAPRVTSQLDPFGHSATQAALFSSPLAGYSATFFARMDFQERDLRMKEQTVDFAWQASTSLGEDAITMAAFGANDGYSTPDGLCFDVSITCFPFVNPVTTYDAPDAQDVNVDEFVSLMLKTASRYNTSYPASTDGTVHIPVYMGSDFHWKAAHMNFASLDKLISATNVNSSTHRVNVFYSTQPEYADARINDSPPLSLRTGDAFPYRDVPHSTWSGYFTSRPALKRYIRDSSAVFQATKQLQMWAGGATDLSPSNPLWMLETNMGVAQHHDAVTGTSKQLVAFDYAKRLAIGRLSADAATSTYLNTLLTPSSPPLQFSSCDLANATICPLTESAAAAGVGVALVMYNPQSHARPAARFRIPVGLVNASGAASWQVFGPDGITPIQSQIIPISPADLALRKTYYGLPSHPAGATSGVMAWLAFQAPIDAMGYTTIFLSPSSTSPPTTTYTSPSKLPSSATISNGQVTLGFNASTGLLEWMQADDVEGGVKQLVSQNLLWYQSSTGDSVALQPSGAYILRVANGTDAQPLANGSVVSTSVVHGDVVSEVRQDFGTWGSQVFRLWHNESRGFELEWTIGPIPIADGVGKEVVSRVDLHGWRTESNWASDSNAREMQNRTRNHRTNYHFNLTQRVADNYFPINSALRIADSRTNLSAFVITDRTHGGGSVEDGQFEIMLHRRILHDDLRGVAEALNEPGVNGDGLVVRGTHQFLFASPSTLAVTHKTAQQDALLPPLIRGTNLSQPLKQWAASHHTTFTALSTSLPPQLSLATVHSWNKTTLLVRVAHLYEEGEDAILSQPATIQLATLFPSLTITAATEMTLIANQPLSHVKPTTYKIKKSHGGVESITLPKLPTPPTPKNLQVTLTPMQIRTFLLTIE